MNPVSATNAKRTLESAIRDRNEWETAWAEERERVGVHDCEGIPCFRCGNVPDSVGIENRQTYPEAMRNRELIAAGLLESSETFDCCGNAIRLPNESDRPVHCSDCGSILVRAHGNVWDSDPNPNPEGYGDIGN